MDVELSSSKDDNDDTGSEYRSLSAAAAVTYCCGACGYDLRLRSSDRNTARGFRGGRGRVVVTFDAVDHARFGHAEEFRCLDVRARRLFARRTRLLCRGCGASIGFGYDDQTASSSSPSPRYDIRIRALQPAVVAAARNGDGAA